MNNVQKHNNCIEFSVLTNHVICTYRVLKGSELLQKVFLQDAMLKSVNIAAECVDLGSQCDHLAATIQFKYQNGDPD